MVLQLLWELRECDLLRDCWASPIRAGIFSVLYRLFILILYIFQGILRALGKYVPTTESSSPIIHYREFTLSNANDSAFCKCISLNRCCWLH